MQALFTGGLGDFIGAESFMTEDEKNSVTTVLWATRNVHEIKAACDLKDIFPNLQEDRILFDDWANDRPTRPWQEGDRFMNIGMKHELNLKCKLNLSQQELDAINDNSLDASLQRIFSGLKWQSSRFVTHSKWPDASHFKLPQKYVAIHPWSDAEINGREFTDADWTKIFSFLERMDLTGVVINRSDKMPPQHPRLIDLTNKTSLKESFSIINGADYCILCASSLACFATKIFPKDRIWLKGGHEHMFSGWATYFYHGPFTNPNDIIFRDFSVLDNISPTPRNNYNSFQQGAMLDQGLLVLL